MLFLLLSFFLPILPQNDKKEILEILLQQQNSWNKGDIPAFMNGYWRSDSLMFVGKSGVTYGWENTLKNYQKSYPNAETMGKLHFTVLKLEILDKKNAFLVGKWHLTRPEKGDVGGHFTLFWKKIKGKWCIVADHSS